MFNLGASSNSRTLESTTSDYGSAHSLLDSGTMLRERRESMGVSLEEVEAATKIRQKYLAALEAEEWSLLPGEVVGRGFLRNYTAYLELDPNEMLERRRSAVDPRLKATLLNTSAGASLPPERAVDYRPKEVDLHDDSDDLDGTRQRSRILPLLLLLGILLFFGWLGFDAISSGISSSVAAVSARIGDIGDDVAAEPPSDTILIDEANGAGVGGSNNTDPDDNGNAVAVVPVVTPTSLPPTPVPPTPELPTPEPPTPEPPTPEPPTPEPPTPVPVPPTDTPVPLPPTLTPTPEPPPVVAAVCPDPGRSAITFPGVNQTVSGILDITGTASHEDFDYYKLEFATGPNGDGEFIYFDGANGPVVGGRLGGFNTTSLPNGAYTIRAVVVDNTGNFSPPCTVVITIQN